jgi:hypothetical protein
MIDFKDDIDTLIQFAEDQGFDIPELMWAVNRIKDAQKEGLRDYAVSTKESPLTKSNR